MNPVTNRTMKKKSPSKEKVLRRLAGRIEFRDGQYVFVPDRLIKDYTRIEEVPYYAR